MSNGDDRFFIFIERGTDPTVSGVDAPINSLCTFEGTIYRKVGDGPNDWEEYPTGGGGGGATLLAFSGQVSEEGNSVLFPTNNGNANPNIGPVDVALPWPLTPGSTIGTLRLRVEAVVGDTAEFNLFVADHLGNQQALVTVNLLTEPDAQGFYTDDEIAIEVPEGARWRMHCYGTCTGVGSGVALAGSIEVTLPP